MQVILVERVEELCLVASAGTASTLRWATARHRCLKVVSFLSSMVYI